jgi:hypothetical protein
MFGLYTPILLLQAFCMYHAYRNNAESRWYWFIFLFSVFGCAFYLYDAFYSRRNINSITETVKAVVNTNYHLEKLEKAYHFSDNVRNAVNLADAYVQYGRYDEAIKLYRSVSTGFMAEDPGIKMKMLNAYFLNKNYSEAIAIGKLLESEKVFSNAEQRIAYAWALHADRNTDAAEKVFEALDRPYTNYEHRLAYCKFLLEAGKKELMQGKAAVLLEEFEHMKGPERKLHRAIMYEVRELYNSSIKTK